LFNHFLSNFNAIFHN